MLNKVYTYLILAIISLIIIDVALFLAIRAQREAAAEIILEQLQEPPTEQKVYEYIKKENNQLDDNTAKELASSLVKESENHNLSLRLMLAVVKTESNFKQYAISSAGALGFWQVLPKYHLDKIAVLENKNLYDPKSNSALGAEILKKCIKKYSSVESALLCYNGSINDSEKKYVKKVYASMSSDF